MSTVISSPFGAPYEENPAVRFRDPTHAAADGASGPRRAGSRRRRRAAPASSRRASMTRSSRHRRTWPAPSSVANSGVASLSRPAYVGRLGRDLLVRRDLAMPLNLVDPRSGMDYFTAAQATINAAQARGITGGSPASRLRRAPRNRLLGEPVPGRGRRRTHRHAGGGARIHAERPDWITALYDMDTACRPPAASSVRMRISPSSTTRLRPSAPSADRTTTRCC